MCHPSDNDPIESGSIGKVLYQDISSTAPEYCQCAPNDQYISQDVPNTLENGRHGFTEWGQLLARTERQAGGFA